MTFQNKDMGGFRELDVDEIKAVSGGNDTIVVTANTGGGLPSFGQFGFGTGGFGDGSGNTAGLPTALAYQAAIQSYATTLDTDEEFDQFVENVQNSLSGTAEWEKDFVNSMLPDGVDPYFYDSNGRLVNEIVVTAVTTASLNNASAFDAYLLANPYVPTYLAPVTAEQVLASTGPSIYGELGFSYLGAAGGFATNGYEAGAFGGISTPGVVANVDASGDFGLNTDFSLTPKPNFSLTYSFPFSSVPIGSSVPVEGFVPSTIQPIYTSPFVGSGISGNYYDISGSGSITPPTYNFNNVGGTFFDIR